MGGSPSCTIDNQQRNSELQGGATKEQNKTKGRTTFSWIHFCTILLVPQHQERKPPAHKYCHSAKRCMLEPIGDCETRFPSTQFTSPFMGVNGQNRRSQKYPTTHSSRASAILCYCRCSYFLHFAITTITTTSLLTKPDKEHEMK